MVSALILSGAIALVALRAGLGMGVAVGVGLGMLVLGLVVPYALRTVGFSLGLPPEVYIFAYPVCGLLSSILALVVALVSWPRPQ